METNCDFIIEAAVENIPLKWEIFAKLDEVTPKETILVSPLRENI
ncbi:MAG: hypothetical protein COZ69_05950 [Deltaproteobacteria bacterium CG_4_8_14_3_um_filter_45_9]|nr:MAG: hypothetical protein COS40_13635 [Deltaproteobacteria bacterium CG03_land_8_20_14_0_80_45_14]PIX24517.1 MAG: hypothetical protein COZ69_05950 [Deltaproteobacteria bacterium CG_4_8_14_3_um_filter_45_9]